MDAITHDRALIGPWCARTTAIMRVLGAIPRVQGYTAHDLHKIMLEYVDCCYLTGLDLGIVFAQICLETAYLSSALSLPPHRNPAGIGATGTDPGVLFPDWHTATWAHCGRLIAYARDSELTQVQIDAIKIAQESRSLHKEHLGKHPTIMSMSALWSTDPRYCESLLRIINHEFRV
jgi:hypothetical protein